MRIYRLSYKKQKEIQRGYFRKALEKDLRDFWCLFGKYGTNKIELLKRFSLKKYNYTPQITYLRNQFNQNIKMKKWIFARCYVCGESPTIAHHIIQLQNGGQNIKKNIIRICEDCHSQIHNWLPQTSKELIVKEQEEYQSMCALDNT